MRARTLGAVLIVLVGLFNFHLPHFVLERGPFNDDAASGLELVFLANLLCAAMAAVAIWHSRRWGWVLGLVVVGLSVVLYLAQETVGLPGLPKNWFEPSRIVSLIVDALFLLVVWNHVVSSANANAGVSRDTAGSASM